MKAMLSGLCFYFRLPSFAFRLSKTPLLLACSGVNIAANSRSTFFRSGNPANLKDKLSGFIFRADTLHRTLEVQDEGPS
jgi:hypothetical protein